MTQQARRFDRRNFLGLTGAAGLAALAAACSSGSSTGSATPTPSPAGGSPAPTSAPAPSASATAPAVSGSPSASVTPPVTVGNIPGAPTLTMWVDSQYVAQHAAAAKGFSDKFGANVKVQPFGFNDILTNFQKAGPAGNGPDLIDANIDWLGPLQQAGLVAPVDFGANAAKFDKRALDGWTQNGAVLGMPITVESLCVLRNPKLLPEPLTNWSQLKTAMDGLVAKKVKYPIVYDSNAYVYIGILTAFGGYCFKQAPDGKVDIADVGLDKPGTVQALDLLATSLKNGWTKPAVDANVVAKAFPANQIGLQVTGPWQILPYQDAKATFAIDPLPAGPAGPAVPWLSARGLLVNKLSKNAALAQSFLTDYWAADGPMATFAKVTAKQSAWLPAQKSNDDATVQALTKAAATALPIPSTPALQAFWPAVGDGLTLLFNKQSTPDKVARTAQAAVSAAAKKAA